MSDPRYRAPAERDPPANEPGDDDALGSLRSSHGPRKSALSRRVLALLCAAFTVPMIVMVLHAAAEDASLLWVLPVPLLLNALPWFLGLTKAVERIDVHQRGLVVRRRGGATETVLFDDVDEVWIEQSWVRTLPVSFALIHGLRFVSPRGVARRVSIEVEDGLSLLRWVLRRCSDPLLPDARAALAAGETLTFGKVKIDREGITVRGARARWDEIRLLRASLGSMALLRRSTLFAWRTVSLDAVPHPTVFARLVSERVKRVERDYPREWEDS